MRNVLVGILLLGAALLGGCGGSEDPAKSPGSGAQVTATPGDPGAGTAEATVPSTEPPPGTELSDGTLSASLEMVARSAEASTAHDSVAFETNSEVTFGESGPESQAATGRIDFRSMRVFVRGQDGDSIQDGTTIYSNGGHDDDVWVQTDLEELTGLPEALLAIMDPARKVELLKGASRVTEEVGTESVRGVQTTHIRLVVDTGKLFDSDTGGRLSRELAATIPDAFDVEVWIDDDDLVRRITSSLEIDSPEIDLTSEQSTVEYFDYGVPGPVSLPAQDDVVDYYELMEYMDEMTSDD